MNRFQNAVTASTSKVMLSAGTCILIDANGLSRVVSIGNTLNVESILVPTWPATIERARVFRRYHGPIVPTFIEKPRPQ